MSANLAVMHFRKMNEWDIAKTFVAGIQGGMRGRKGGKVTEAAAVGKDRPEMVQDGWLCPTHQSHSNSESSGCLLRP